MSGVNPYRSETSEGLEDLRERVTRVERRFSEQMKAWASNTLAGREQERWRLLLFDLVEDLRAQHEEVNFVHREMQDGFERGLKLAEELILERIGRLERKEP